MFDFELHWPLVVKKYKTKYPPPANMAADRGSPSRGNDLPGTSQYHVSGRKGSSGFWTTLLGLSIDVAFQQLFAMLFIMKFAEGALQQRAQGSLEGGYTSKTHSCFVVYFHQFYRCLPIASVNLFTLGE